jgi:hypothetical protein
MSGKYRLAAGAGGDRTFSVNDSNSDLQDRDFHYLFGEKLENTYDPAIYSAYQLDIEGDITPDTQFYTEMVADPWSYVGHTSEIEIKDSNPASVGKARVQQRYWGPNNSTAVTESIRASDRNILGLRELEAHGGNTQSFNMAGHPDFFGNYVVPEQDIDYEFRPMRKLWVDHEGDIWHLRVFALADHNQAMVTDDPLTLSGLKDYWQHSAWVNEWKPIQIFTNNTDGRSIRRGYYDVDEAFAARHSDGQYLTLLRGTAFEADFGRTYVGAMIASKFGMWDDYTELNNVPGVVRLKHQVTPQWMVGGLYGYRVGMIDREPDAYNQVISVDTRYQFNETDYAYAQAAGSRNEIDRLSSFDSAHEGQSYRVGWVKNVVSDGGATTKFHADAAWMDTTFQPTLSRYGDLKHDEFWGKHITFTEFSHDLEPFKIGTGLDRGTYVGRLTIRSEVPQWGVENLFDARHVRQTDSNSFIEHVMRDEFSYQIDRKSVV